MLDLSIYCLTNRHKGTTGNNLPGEYNDKEA